MSLLLTSSTPLPASLLDDLDGPDHFGGRYVCSLAYSSFAALRADVAACYDVKPYGRRWGRRPQLPVGGTPFWLHSDCEGTWSTSECADIADLLGAYADCTGGWYGDLAAHLSAACYAIAVAGGELRFG